MGAHLLSTLSPDEGWYEAPGRITVRLCGEHGCRRNRGVFGVRPSWCGYAAVVCA
ncbi:hypothetical protein ACVWWN_003450 [Mycobacterium sp. URHB0021]|jgi:hypothetical protein